MANETRRVLVIDDDELARVEIARCVEQQGHSASVARHGGEGLEMLRSRNFDLVLLDLLMPEVDGFEVLRRMNEDPALRAIPVIVITAAGERENSEKCMEMGAVAHLGKPVDPKMLAERVSAVFAGRM